MEVAKEAGLSADSVVKNLYLANAGVRSDPLVWENSTCLRQLGPQATAAETPSP